MWNRLSKREKVLLIGLFGGGIIFCLVYFILNPQFKAYAQVKNELNENKEKLSKAQATVASLKNENDKLIKVREDFAVKDKPFASRMRDGSDIIFLGLVSATENIEITDIEPGDIIEKPHSLELPLKIGVQGDYLGLIEFCKDIDKQMKESTNLTEIRSLKIQSSSQSSSQSSNQSSSSKEPAFNLGASPGTVKATIGIVMFSSKNPEGRLYLEEVSRWLIGRSNVFRSSSAVAPYPELSGSLRKPSDSFSISAGQSSGSYLPDGSDRDTLTHGPGNTQTAKSDPKHNHKK